MFDPERAEKRFGCGLAPGIAGPSSAAAMMERLRAPDEAGAAFPIQTFSQALPRLRDLQLARQARRTATTDAARDKALETYRTLRSTLRQDAARWGGHVLLRRALTRDGLRERLTAFWADHFTARGDGQLWGLMQLPYVEEAVRPHVTGRFEDMLRAVMTQPLMLTYLDQHRSAGPNSPVGQTRGRGLNENLAREMLELHTLGADGPYSQTDVTELAKLLTGLTFNMERGFEFRPRLSEPGAETVLCISYGGETARLDDIFAALDALATHPATAAHIARKLAVHFVSDTPDAGLVDALRDVFTATGGDLASLTETLLTHPAAWQPETRNVKRPVDFIGSALRALDLVPRHIPLSTPRKMDALFAAPLTLMGQPPGQPTGPNGFAEDDFDWITPQRLAARISWAMTAPFQIRRALPRPEEFARAALGQDIPAPVRSAARGAETRAEGIGLILASPAFQRV